MPRMTFSISVPPDLGALLKAYGSEGGNISGLVCKLLRAHFGQGGGGLNMAGALSAEMAGRLSSLQDEVKRLSTDLERYKTYAEEARVAEEEKQAEITLAIRAAFSEMEEGGLEGWRADVCDSDISRYCTVRAGLLASRVKVSEAEMKAEILQIYPALEGYL